MTSENEMVSLLTEHFALKCGYSPKEAKQIRTAAALHDIGKARIPQTILRKPGKLTPEEFEIMKMHTKYGEKILTPMQGTLGKMARQVALLHHEKFDKSGYWGYDSSELPNYVNIVSICDVTCSLLHERCYKPP